MALTKEVVVDKIEVAGDYKHLQIREIIQVPRLDKDNNPVLLQVEKVDKDDSPVLDKEGEPILIDGEQIIDSGGYHRRVLTPDVDVSGEVQEIQDKAKELWTDEVKSAWTTFQAEQEALMNRPE